MTGAGFDVLDSLVAKSLVVARDCRLALLEPIRQYAVGHLEARPDAHEVRERHAAHYLAEQIAVARAGAFPTFYYEAFLGFAALVAARRDDHDAALLATASELNDDRGIYESEKPVYDKVQARFLALARERLGEAAWDRAGDEARSMTTEAVPALADAVRSRYEEAPAVAGA